MAFYAGLSSAFSPEMLASRRTPMFAKMVAETLPNTESIDRSLVGLDDTAMHNVFDPTAGNSPAVTRNNNGETWVKQRSRPRRNRKSAAVRAMVRENIVTPSNFIYPLFIHDEDHNVPIPSMPGCERHSLSSMMKEIGEAWDEGVQTFILFPKVADELKTNLGVEAYNPDGIVPRAIRMIKEKFPDSVVCTDVALDPYSDQGHDGVVENGKILNDVTITQLCKQAVMQARAGADIVAPSDMMVCYPKEIFLKLSYASNFFLWNCLTLFNQSFRMVVLELSVMLWTQKDSLMCQSWLIPRNTHLRIMDLSEMRLIATRGLVIKRLTNKTQQMVGKLYWKLLWMPLKVQIC